MFLNRRNIASSIAGMRNKIPKSSRLKPPRSERAPDPKSISIISIITRAVCHHTGLIGVPQNGQWV
jgi:hypothetical protein